MHLPLPPPPPPGTGQQEAVGRKHPRTPGWAAAPTAALDFPSLAFCASSLHKRFMKHQGAPTLFHSFPPTHSTNPCHQRNVLPLRLTNFPGSIQLTQQLSECGVSGPGRRARAADRVEHVGVGGGLLLLHKAEEQGPNPPQRPALGGLISPNSPHSIVHCFCCPTSILLISLCSPSSPWASSR